MSLLHNGEGDGSVMPMPVKVKIRRRGPPDFFPPVWIVDNVMYDLRPFVPLHPGGALFLEATRGRDISAQFFTHHVQAHRLLPLLQKYKIDDLPTQLAHTDEQLMRIVTEENEMMHTKKKFNFKDGDKDTFTHTQTHADESSKSNNSISSKSGVDSVVDTTASVSVSAPDVRIFPPSFLWPHLTADAFSALFMLHSRRYNMFHSPALTQLHKQYMQSSKIRDEVKKADDTFDRHIFVVIGIYIISILAGLRLAHSLSSSSFSLFSFSSLLSLDLSSLLSLFFSIFLCCVWICAMALIRQCMTSAGHYSIHRASSPIVNAAELLFDASYGSGTHTYIYTYTSTYVQYFIIFLFIFFCVYIW